MIIILNIALKDLTRSIRSTFAIGVTVIAPLLLVGLFFFAFNSTPSEDLYPPLVKVGIVNADRLPADALRDLSLGEDIRSLFFDENLVSWISASDYPDEVSARAAVEKQEIGVALIIPKDFSQRTLVGEKDTHIKIISNPTMRGAAQVVQNMVIARLDGLSGGVIAIQTVIERQRFAELKPEPTQVQMLIERYAAWYAESQQDLSHHTDQATLVMVAPPAEGASQNPVQKMLGQMMAGQMAFFAFFTGAYSMMSILREEEEGTLARLFTTPVPRGFILAGKFIAVFLSVILQGVVLIIAARYAFGINWGEPLALILALTGQVIAATGLGVFLISFVKTTQQAGPVLGGGLTVLGLIGGLFTSGISIPEVFTRLAIITPQGWVIKAWNVVLSGQPLPELMLQFGMLIVMGTVMFVIGVMMFRKRFAQ